MNSASNLKAASNPLRKGILNCAAAIILALVSFAPQTARAVAPSSGVSCDEILTAAQNVLTLNSGWKIFMVKGQSMEPQFGKNSVLLTSPGNFKDLRPGMLVVYKDAFGDLVAHRLMENTGKGWIAKGYNNKTIDPGLVTEANLQGVIFGVLNYKSGTDTTSAVAATNHLPVALAKTY